jgi:phosphoserine phosphatase
MPVDVRERLDAFLRRHARNTSTQAVAVFDCDGTVIKGDIGEAMFYRQIEQFQFRINPATLWPDHPHHKELGKTYQQLSLLPAGERRSNPAFEPFARMLLDWYVHQIEDGHVAKACADIVRLYAGFTRTEVRAFAETMFLEELSTPFSVRPLGGRDSKHGVRYLQEAVDLLELLRNNGFDIWAVSGSSKWSVEPVFAKLRIPPERVIGIDLEERDGLLTGTPVLPIPIREDKIHALRAQELRLPVLVASDSRNDIPLFGYSEDLRVLVNSRKPTSEEFFRSGEIPRDERWIVYEQPTPIMNESTHTHA